MLRRIVDDILSGDVDSRRLNRATDIEEYFAALPQELQPGDESRVANPKAFRAISLAGSQATPPRKPPAKKKSAPRKRKTLAPKTHPFDATSSTKLGMLVGEAGLLNIERLPLSAAFVLRAVVELAVNDYMKKHNLPLGPPGGPEFDLTKKASDVVGDLKSSGTVSGTDLRAFRNRAAHPDVRLFHPVAERFRPQSVRPAERGRSAGGMGGVPAVTDRHVRKPLVPRAGIGPTGRYSPLRYPGGKGKLAKFMGAGGTGERPVRRAVHRALCGGGWHRVGVADHGGGATGGGKRHQPPRERVLDVRPCADGRPVPADPGGTLDGRGVGTAEGGVRSTGGLVNAGPGLLVLLPEPDEPVRDS